MTVIALPPWRDATADRPRAARKFFAVAMIAAATFRGDPASAEDRVTLRGPTGIGSVILTGRVIDWTGRTLRLRETSEDLREIDADRVQSVDTVRLAAHVGGMKALAKGNIDEAQIQLSKALAEEPRKWMRREILAQLIRADLAQGDRLTAGRHFLAIYESDPTTFWYGRLPLEWRIHDLDFHGLATARQWIEPDKSEVSHLLGASLLLFSPGENSKAIETLKALAASPDPRVFPLARAQLWRRDLRSGSVSRREANRWADRLREIPKSLRGGPRFLIGHGYAATGDLERAATNWLWLPLVHDQNPRLAAKAEVLAADRLMQIGKSTAAIVLYREVIERFGFTPAGDMAQQALAEISESLSSAKGNESGRNAANDKNP